MTCNERINSEQYGEFLLNRPFTPLVRQEYPELQQDTTDYCYVKIDGDIGVVYLNRAEIGSLTIPPFSYQGIPKVYGLMQQSVVSGITFDPLSLINSGITSVQQEPLSLTGKGVVVAFLDTGINYTSEVFKKPDGTSRILAIWDQTITNGDAPEGFLYGAEYTRDNINEALRAAEPLQVVPSVDENGHGTAMASVAAGSRLDGGNAFLGAAPEADILVVKLRECKQYLRDYYLIPEEVPCYSEVDILFALKYISNFLIPYERPVVICIGLGTNMGSHRGTSILSDYLNTLSEKRNMSVVVCGGNEGNMARHYEAILDTGGERRIDEVEIRVGERNENTRGFVMEIWGTVPAVFTMSVRSPGGERTPVVNFRIPQSVVYRFVYDKTILRVDYVLVEQGSGEQLILLRFQDPTPGIWTVTLTNESDTIEAPVHIWLPIEAFLPATSNFLRPSPYTTITEPGFTGKVITTSTYNDRDDSFYIASGRGWGRGGELKPDFAAPGVMVSTVLGDRTGASIASAITAGAVAQFVQWAVLQNNDPWVNNENVKSYFIRGASREDTVTYPNRETGFGLLNLQGVFDSLAEQ